MEYLSQVAHVALYYALPFVIVLGIMIFFHELGHFLLAKYFGVKVLCFSLGFGPKLWGKQMGETEYRISSMPLGGYVKMLGESRDDDEPIPPEDEHRAFHNQHALKRIAIVAAGPVFNLILAFFLFWGLFFFSGDQVLTTKIGQVRPESPAERAGLEKDDVIVSVNGQDVASWSDVKEQVQLWNGPPISMTIRRGEGVKSLSVIPEAATEKNIFGEEIQSALIGIVASGEVTNLDLGPLQAFRAGFNRTVEITGLTCMTIVKLFQRVVPIKMLGGPIMIGQMTGQLVQENLAYIIPFMAVISINLAILNLLPVPILDGGVILFLIIEMIARRPISLRKQDLAQKVGLFLLVFLMVVVFYNDIARLLE
jgi:regulator of sigma E protease